MTIIKRNLLRDESAAPAKVYTVLFDTGRLKITMIRHVACRVSQDHISTLCLCAAEFLTMGWKLHASGLENKNLQTCTGKKFFLIQ